jgi:hypothetical protein
MKKLLMVLLVVAGISFVRTPVLSYQGLVQGGVNLSDGDIKIGETFNAKIMLNSGSNKISVAYITLGIDTTKVKVKSVVVNRNNFSDVYLEKESGGVISVYGTNSSQSGSLSSGSIEVATVTMEAVSSGSFGLVIKTYEVTGPSTSSDFSYQLNWPNTNILIGSSAVLPTPTSISGNGSDGVLKFKVSFLGVNSSAKCVNNWPVDVTILENGGNMKKFPNVQLVANGDGTYRGEVLLTGVSTKNNLAVFIKGPRHVQVKYANDAQSEFYNQPGGNISVGTNASQAKIYDFSRYPLTAGDANKDGSVDGIDFSYVKTEVNKRTEGDGMVADLNGNCKLESQDLTLLMLAMKDKQAQLY